MTDDMRVATTETQSITGVSAIAALDDAAFARNLMMLEKGQDRVRQIQRALMKKGIDYGEVPGTDKPTLLKSGAEILTLAFGLAARIVIHPLYGNDIDSPALLYDADSFVHVGNFDGPIVAVGHGTANSWETKYRWRKGSRVCPDCGKPGVIATRKHAFWHPEDAKPDGGCGANFTLDDPRLANQSLARVANADPLDLANTLMKMASKRAFVDGALRATGTSGLFTQDMDDLPAQQDDDPEEVAAREYARSQRSGAAVSPSGTAHGTASGTVTVPANMCGWGLEKGGQTLYCMLPLVNGAPHDGKHSWDAQKAGGRLIRPGVGVQGITGGPESVEPRNVTPASTGTPACGKAGPLGDEPCYKPRTHSGPHESNQGIWPFDWTPATVAAG